MNIEIVRTRIDAARQNMPSLSSLEDVEAALVTLMPKLRGANLELCKRALQQILAVESAVYCASIELNEAFCAAGV